MAKERVAARTVKTDLVANLAMSYSIERVYLESIAIEIECNFDDIKWNWSNSSNDRVGSICCFSLWFHMVSIIDDGPYTFSWDNSVLYRSVRYESYLFHLTPNVCNS